MGHPTQTKSLLYAIIAPWVRLGVRWFFRRVEVRNRELVPADKPVILIANHQNALLDPVLISLFSNKQCHWLTRSDVFRNPTVGNILRKLNMLPIYRERDKLSDMSEKNLVIFNICYGRLQRGAMICLFPEGTHRGRKQLAPLKKGTARLVAGAMQEGVHDVYIMPVGIELGDFYNPDTTLLLQFGQPKRLLDFYKPEEIQQAKSQNDLTKKLRDWLEPVMIHIEDDELYEDFMFIQHVIAGVHPRWSLSKQFEAFQGWIHRMKSDDALRSEFVQRVKPWIALSNQLEIQPDTQALKTPVKSVLLFLLTFPIAILGWIYFRPIHLLSEWVIRTKIQDTLFYNSIRVSVWTFATPIYVALTFGVLMLFMPAVCAISSLGILVFSGFFVKIMVRQFSHVKNILKLRSTAKKHPSDWKKWQEGQQDAVNWLRSIIPGF